MSSNVNQVLSLTSLNAGTPLCSDKSYLHVPGPYSWDRNSPLWADVGFPATLATRPPDQAPGLLPLTLPLHSESNGEAFPGHCTKRRHMHVYTGLPSSSGKKNLPAVEELQQTQVQSLGRKIPRRRQGYPLQDYSGLESSVDRGAWQSPCHRVRHG